MNKVVVIAFLLLASVSAYAQIGKTKAAILAEFGQDRVLKESKNKPGYTGMLLSLDSVRYMQVTFKGDQAVMVSYMHADSALSEQQYKQYISQNLPGFTAKKNCSAGAKSYLIDQKKNQLVQQSHARTSGGFPLLGLIIATDPAIISSLSSKVGKLCE